MKSSIKKKIIVASIITPIIGFLAFILFYSTRTSQTELTADRTNGLLGQMAMLNKPCFVELRPGLQFKLDSGSDISYIAEQDLAMLDSLGYQIRESFYPIMGRDGVGDTDFSAKRYTVDLPIYQWQSETDSTGNVNFRCLYATVNTLRNVDFSPSSTGFSVLGADFMEKFKLELVNADRLIGLYFDNPKGYNKLIDLNESHSFASWLTPSHRYYFPATIDEDVNEYFLDTGLQKAFVKRPAKELTPGGKHVTKGMAKSYRGEWPAMLDPDGWLTIGDRQGKALIYYYDNDEETHAINPFNMVRFDMLLDLGNKAMWIHENPAKISLHKELNAMKFHAQL